MEFRVLKYFLAVARTENISHAAEAMHVSQPALSRQLMDLEEELGVKATVVATGGISRFVLPMCRSEIRYDRDLLLRGLRILYEKNKR